MGSEGLLGTMRTWATGAISRIMQQNCPILFAQVDWFHGGSRDPEFRWRRGLPVVAAGGRVARGDARAAPGTRLRPRDTRRRGHDGAGQQSHALPTVADEGRTGDGGV